MRLDGLDLGWAYQKVGDILQQQGRLAEAKGEYADAKQIFELLTARDPDNSSWQTSLASTLGRLSDVVGRVPYDAVLLNLLSSVYEQIYMSNWDLGDMETALSAATACLEITKQWSTLDAANSDALNRVAAAYTIVGNAERRLKRLSDAQAAVSSGLEIRKELDPNRGPNSLRSCTGDSTGFDKSRPRRSRTVQ
jgi:tetratricopeptide (TPR) repeat protein